METPHSPPNKKANSPVASRSVTWSQGLMPYIIKSTAINQRFLGTPQATRTSASPKSKQINLGLLWGPHTPAYTLALALKNFG